MDQWSHKNMPRRRLPLSLDCQEEHLAWFGTEINIENIFSKSTFQFILAFPLWQNDSQYEIYVKTNLEYKAFLNITNYRGVIIKHWNWVLPTFPPTLGLILRLLAYLKFILFINTPLPVDHDPPVKDFITFF